MRARWLGPLALVAAAGLLAGCGSSGKTDDGAGGSTGKAVSKAGTVVHGAAAASGTTVTAIVPSGKLVITVGKATSKVSAAQSKDKQAHTAAKGDTFLPLSWSFDQDALSVDVHDAVRVTTAKDTSVAVVADGHRYALGSAYSDVATKGLVSTSEAASYLAVPATGSRTIEVTYDGLTQVFDAATGTRTPGVADAFYRAAAVHSAPSCPQANGTTAGISYRVSCSVGKLVEVPYVAGLGWAPSGKVWATTTYQLKPVRAAHGSTTYRFTATRATATLGGTAAQQAGAGNDEETVPVITGHPAFAVAPGSGALTLTLQGSWRLSPNTKSTLALPLSVQRRVVFAG